MGIEAYLAFQWWLGLATIFFLGLAMIISEYPRTIKQSLSEDSLLMILNIGLFFWCSFLRFGIN